MKQTKKTTIKKTVVKKKKVKEEKKEEEKEIKKVEDSKEAITAEETEGLEGLDIKSDKYFEAVGRRKTAIARVRVFTRGEKGVFVNGKPCQEYFPILDVQQVAIAALKKMKCLDKFQIVAKVTGGGFHAQAEAIRLATARALEKFNPDFRKRLSKTGYLTRDPRMRERKKFGLKRARRAPQWQKR